MDKSTYIPGGKEYTARPVTADSFKEQSLQVMDRKTGEMYNPQEQFDEMMARADIQAIFKRLSIR